MAITYREENIVVIELGSFTVKALKDITDVNKLPTVQVRTIAGILKNEDTNNTQQANKEQPTEDSPAEPTHQQDDTKHSAETEEDKQNKEHEVTEESNTKDTDGTDISYVFGSNLESTPSDQLDNTIEIIQNGRVQDWEALGALLRYVLRELGITRIATNYCSILFTVPPYWNKFDLESLVQVAFEHLNSACIVVLDQPLAAVYGNAMVNGLVVDMGHENTVVTAVVDSCVMGLGYKTPVGGKAVEIKLAELLDKSLDNPNDLAFVRAIKESGLCKLQLLATTEDELAQGDEQAERTVAFEYQGEKHTLSPKKLSEAVSILVNPPQPYTPLGTLMKQAVLACEVDRRAALWENIHLVGGSSRFPQLKEYLQMELEKSVLPTSNNFSSTQSREIKFASLPEYFVGWRNKDYMVGFLGAMIVAKITVNDAKYNITRAEYNESGPSIIHTKSF
ncbi:hypothetical protein GGI07_001549 [Coemansia sp. Benny D115]|nr:hypothetical protein GGI07_001549 [Coemansia sp. Benny D115]